MDGRFSEWENWGTRENGQKISFFKVTVGNSRRLRRGIEPHIKTACAEWMTPERMTWHVHGPRCISCLHFFDENPTSPYDCMHFMLLAGNSLSYLWVRFKVNEVRTLMRHSTVLLIKIEPKYLYCYSYLGLTVSRQFSDFSPPLAANWNAYSNNSSISFIFWPYGLIDGKIDDGNVGEHSGHFIFRKQTLFPFSRARRSQIRGSSCCLPLLAFFFA